MTTREVIFDAALGIALAGWIGALWIGLRSITPYIRWRRSLGSGRARRLRPPFTLRDNLDEFHLAVELFRQAEADAPGDADRRLARRRLLWAGELALTFISLALFALVVRTL
jgi:hypothetical protein